MGIGQHRLTHVLKAPKTQLLLSLGSLILSALLWIGAALVGWLELVAFVSHVSMAALVLSSLSGVVSALVLLEAATGTNLTLADRRWIEGTIRQALEPLAPTLAAVRAEVTVSRAEIMASHRILLSVEQQVAHG